MSVTYGTNPTFGSPYTYDDKIGSWTGGTATITTNWPLVEVETKKEIALNCLVCDKPTEYTYTVTLGYIQTLDDGEVPDMLALCPTCLEAVKEMRNHFIVGEIAEIMEG